MIMTEEEMDEQIELIQEPPKTYEQGLEDAWELAKKMLYVWFQDENEEFTKEYGSSFDFISKHTPQEAMQKMQEWEDRNSFKVGDIVKFKDGTKAVVMDIESEETLAVFTENECSESGIFKYAINKTGRNVADQLNALLEAVKGE